MPHSDDEVYVSPEERCRLIEGIPAFSPWPIKIRAGLAELMREEVFSRGTAVVAENEPGNTLYVIAEGRAEVTVSTPDGPLLLAVLQDGEMFGEGAVFGGDGIRNATVTAVVPMLALAIDAPELERYLHLFPRARAALVASGERRRIAAFLKLASPFARLDAEAVTVLTSKMESVSVPTGKVIVRQGQKGDACYLLRTGSVDVSVEDPAGDVVRIAVLGPGALIGEAALLTDAARNATVRALEPSTVLVLRRDDLMHVVVSNRAVGDALRGSVLRHSRPLPAGGVRVEQRQTGDGELLMTLKGSGNADYRRLARDGWFVWQRLDGKHTLGEIEDEYGHAFPELDSGFVEVLVRDLLSAGLIDAPRLREEALPPPDPPWWRRLRHGH